MTNPGDPFAVIFAEFERLGLNYLDLPGLAMAGSDEAEAEFLAHPAQAAARRHVARRLPRSAAHWVPGKEDDLDVPVQTIWPI